MQDRQVFQAKATGMQLNPKTHLHILQLKSIFKHFQKRNHQVMPSSTTTSAQQQKPNQHQTTRTTKPKSQMSSLNIPKRFNLLSHYQGDL